MNKLKQIEATLNYLEASGKDNEHYGFYTLLERYNKLLTKKLSKAK